MSFDSGPLDRFLTAAVGDDPAMAAELRDNFVQNARELVDLMRRARCDANWHMAALRLKSLAATFGVIALIERAEQAMDGAPGDPAVLRDIVALLDEMG